VNLSEHFELVCAMRVLNIKFPLLLFGQTAPCDEFVVCMPFE